MHERPSLRPTERRYGWVLAVIGILVALIAELTRPSSDDIEGRLGAPAPGFALGFTGLVGMSVLAARYLISWPCRSSGAWVSTSWSVG